MTPCLVLYILDMTTAGLLQSKEPSKETEKTKTATQYTLTSNLMLGAPICVSLLNY